MKNDPHSYFWGHYCTDRLGAMADYGERISQEAQYLESYQKQKTEKESGC